MRFTNDRGPEWVSGEEVSGEWSAGSGGRFEAQASARATPATTHHSPPPRGPRGSRSTRYDGLRNDFFDMVRTTRELWRQDGALVCLLVMPPALVLYLVLEVLIRFRLFSRLDVQRFLDGHSDHAREDEEKLKGVDRKLANGYHAQFTAEGEFVLRKGPPPQPSKEMKQMLELLGDSPHP
jgi:hypothetical protein